MAPWHSLDLANTYAALASGSDGLTSEQARERLAEHGPNVIQRVRGEGPLRILWRQIDNPLIWVLLGSAVVAVGLGKVTDGLVVLAVVVLNSLIGFIQEHRASRAIEALRDMVPEYATALRDGARHRVPVADLVPGDSVLLASGDKVPADLRLAAVKNLRCEEAALTGESVSSEKAVAPVTPDAAIGDRSSMAFGGTLVSYGTATGLVVATGANTELGRIATLIEGATDLETPLTRALGTIGKYIAVAIVVISAVILTIGVLRATGAGLPLNDALRETLIFAIALAVGAIPEGLPAIVTISLAIGVQRMANRRAIIRKLPAVETLGSTTVICSDKTGTLTRNEMTVVEVWTPQDGPCQIDGVGYAPFGRFRSGDAVAGAAPEPVRRLLLDAALCSDAALRQAGGHWVITGDPTEGALVVAAEKAGVGVDEARRRHGRHDAIPFESENQLMATLHATPEGGRRAIVKGAPEAVLGRCGDLPGAGDLDALHAEVHRMASGGMRVLALAEKSWDEGRDHLHLDDLADGLRFLGLVGMIDPPRPEAIAAILACQGAGITVKMITGDHRATAQAIGRQLGLANAEAAVAGAALEDLSPARLGEVATATSVFARVAPEHKLRLVRALQTGGHVVAMTGDGVNDAPALKQANIGVAMGITGSSVSKEAADVVLTDDNFASIVAAVEEGRRVYDNLIKSLAFVLPTNLGLALILIYAVLLFPFDPQSRLLLLPIEPVQILWINLVAAVALALPLAFEAKESDIMHRPPRDPRAPVLSRFVVWRTILAALLMTAGAIWVFQWYFDPFLDPATAASDTPLAKAQTMAVTTVIMFQIFYLQTSRSLRHSLWHIGLTSNPAIYVGVATLLLVQVAYIYLPPLQSVFGSAPLGWADLLIATLVGSLIVPVVAAEKWLLRRMAAWRASGG
ncbi:MAG TPA: HAD-IC family P-type ATPase [Chromatiaceae bacterium]|nr:HAD-IC family P-type ATPase [Chromatiaceae bacterium]